jgi:DNA-binding transcriptional ArsR family regulator
LAQSPASVSELATPFDMALPSFVQHLGVLEASGVVRSAKAGRVRTYELVPDRLGVAEGWLSAQRDVWEQRADRFASYVDELQRSQS